MMVPFNIYAILASTVWMMVLGFLWFGPVFGKMWMKSQGITEEEAAKFRNDPAMKSKMNTSYGLMALGSLIMMFVLSHSLIFAAAYMQVSGISAGLQAGFWNWLGFTMPISLSGVLWDRKSWTWFFITTAYYLVGLLGAGIILALWV